MFPVETVALNPRQLGGDCFTTCLTNAMLSGKCMNSFSPDFSCMCSDSSFKSDTDSCLKSTCDGSAKLQDAQTTWGYFCVYVNSGAYTGLPTATGPGINFPTSLLTRTTKPSTSPTSSSSSGNSNNGNGNNPNSNGGNDNTGGTSKESKVPLGAIIGGAVGGVALILMVVFMILYFRRKRKPAQNLNEKYPQGPPNPAFQQQFVPPQPPVAHMNMGPSPVINPSMAGGASPNPSFNSATPFMNQASGYAPSANSFVSGQTSFNNLQPVASYPTQPSHLPPGAGIGVPMSSQGQIYPENTGSTNIVSPFLSPTSAHSHSFNSHPSMPPPSHSSSSIPTTSDNSRLTMISTNSQQHLLGMTTYSSPNSSVPSPPSTGSSPSQQAAAQLNEKQRLQIHLEYQDGAATAGSSSSAAGGPTGLPQSGFHVTNSHQQDGLDGRSVVYSTTTTSGVGSKGGAYNVTNPTSDRIDAPPVYSEQS